MTVPLFGRSFRARRKSSGWDGFRRLYVDAGVVLTILPLLILYLLLQRRFIEGVERSGILG